MARPVRPRRVTEGLAGQVFRPQTPALTPSPVKLTLDGLEALRLADLEGLYQVEAARRMGVSRPTFARVLAGARTAIAEALVHGKPVEIAGGVVKRSLERRWPCPVHRSGPRRGRDCHCREHDLLGSTLAKRRTT